MRNYSKHLFGIRFIIESLLLLMVGMVLTLNLLNEGTLGNFYVTVAGQLPVNVNWVRNHIILVSDVGHAVSGFFLAILIIFLNVRKRYYRYLIVLAGFAICCELMQLFTATRQFKLLDIGYSLGGIGLASCLFFLIKRSLPAQE